MDRRRKSEPAYQFLKIASYKSTFHYVVNCTNTETLLQEIHHFNQYQHSSQFTVTILSH
jgi:hypothetical protein